MPNLCLIQSLMDFWYPLRMLLLLHDPKLHMLTCEFVSCSHCGANFARTSQSGSPPFVFQSYLHYRSDDLLPSREALRCHIDILRSSANQYVISGLLSAPWAIWYHLAAHRRSSSSHQEDTRWSHSGFNSYQRWAISALYCCLGCWGWIVSISLYCRYVLLWLSVSWWLQQ